MKNHSLVLLLLLIAGTVAAQNSSRFRNNNQRNGYTESTGPLSADLLWEVDDAFPSSRGFAVYTFGDRFVTSRVTFNPQYTGVLECRDLNTGQLIWISEVKENAIPYLLGFDDHAVYTHDYATDSVYALSPEDGQILWRASLEAAYFAAQDGAVFACNGDLILNGPNNSSIFTMRLDRETGEVLWTNGEVLSVRPDRTLVAYNGTAYRVSGFFFQPQQLVAIDLETGQTLYSSENMPGDNDQENPVIIGKYGEIIVSRDGGQLFCFRDTGSGFELLWSYMPTGQDIRDHPAIDTSGHVIIIDEKVKRLDRTTGMVLDSSEITSARGTIAVDATNRIFLNNTEGRFYCLSPNLQEILWQITAPGNLYCNPSISQNGTFIITDNSNTIRAYRDSPIRKPLADFTASTFRVAAGTPVDFFDQSSFSPTSWSWTFEGATTSSSNQANPSGIVWNNMGTYSVTLVASNFEGVDTLVRECLIEVEGTVGAISDASSERLLNVFPNPAGALLNVHWRSLQIPDQANLSVWNAHGQLMLNTPFYQNMQLQTAHWPVGLYMLQVADPNGQQLGIKRVIVAR
ncbi:PQQ-binding-like beta-propeller repeat protein [Phaeodactylibacter sp.]|uniref:outer membrane protein assembly factor BamB family protein n=1 Tax=Phaeodactylibacter sp. TaxID=1940289 RepID=UPI0025F74034|nr:PQQ-binding-like beta-propeller repeat protein [Phaeodactylibacter sp.]MCI4649109.1 PQQ-binding-like beta-propeller repeat protein [Phaeodactylibacter sp.]MCI5091510.1 PQQ-binding-like beta-propeller repeat protein [Phaeodactylibacter sp.]